MRYTLSSVKIGASKDELAEVMAGILKDYRKEEGFSPKKDNILKWVEQFSVENRKIILEEMVNIFEKRYLLENEVDDFLMGLITNKKLINNNTDFWNTISLLQIQKNGHSQELMNEKFKQIIKTKTNIDVALNDTSKKHFIHVDDFLFTGNRLKIDLLEWLKTAPENSKVDIIYIGYYKNGQYHAQQELKRISEPKNISLRFWSMAEMENNPNCQNVAEVLWPTNEIKTYEVVEEYLQTQGEKYKLRDKSQIANYYCNTSIFTSDKNREILEKEFTLAGLKIINSINLTDRKKWKPLGVTSFPGFGFGALIFSYRNCPNNTPLVFWWGDWNNNPMWYPLLQRKTYAKTAAEIFGRK